jgi:hypothetical protein
LAFTAGLEFPEAAEEAAAGALDFGLWTGTVEVIRMGVGLAEEGRTTATEEEALTGATAEEKPEDFRGAAAEEEAWTETWAATAGREDLAEGAAEEALEEAACW